MASESGIPAARSAAQISPTSGPIASRSAALAANRIEANAPTATWHQMQSGRRTMQSSRRSGDLYCRLQAVELWDGSLSDVTEFNMSNESLLWSGSPSQATNLPVFVLCVLMCFKPFLIPVAIIVAVVRYLQVRATRVEVTSRRLVVHSGIFSTKRDEMELSRVHDIQLTQPLLLWLLKLANMALVSSDVTSPVIHLRGIPNAYALRETIRRRAETRGDSEGVRDFEIGHLVARA
jgi:uncharacterized membrane protein YdbT with pleckstrin-like domain